MELKEKFLEAIQEHLDDIYFYQEESVSESCTRIAIEHTIEVLEEVKKDADCLTCDYHIDKKLKELKEKVK